MQIRIPQANDSLVLVNEQPPFQPRFRVSHIVGFDMLGSVDCIRFDIKGEPIAQARMRMHHRRRGRTVLYDPSKRLKDLLRNEIRNDLISTDFSDRDFPLFQDRAGSSPDLSISVKFFIARDKDLDNMLKALMDVLQVVVYSDDRKIKKISAKKFRANNNNARLELAIAIAPNDDGDN